MGTCTDDSRKPWDSSGNQHTLRLEFVECYTLQLNSQEIQWMLQL
ncbi:hypothetical protein L798_02625 [Zootermopsis nevadensis]|uniref:Uncharacterized protein n=1 Tax=Zootermopsis nevadensis TaxID=136037 RepID=A0A067QH00_ZOONE|nr:hypothetical protein L798_02625 [Zootermopsis nevadensis]